jgi:Peptidase family M23
MGALSGKAKGVAAGCALGLVVLGLTAGEARGSPGWRWPVEGRVITPFANAADPYAGGMHRGVDIAAPVGTPVLAARQGEVTYAGALGYSGLTVAVRTVDGYVTSYLHLAAVSVKRGEALDAGSRVGEVGTTGRRSQAAPHLHFGVRHAGEENGYVDPLSLLPARPGATEGAQPAPVPATAPAGAQEAPAAAVPARVRPRVAAHTGWPRGVAVHLPRAVIAVPRTSADRAPAARAGSPRARAVPVAPRVAPGARPAPTGRPLHAAPPRAHEAPKTAPDWGRPLALGGLAVLLIALLGRGALRALRAAMRLREIGDGRLRRPLWRWILRDAT